MGLEEICSAVVFIFFYQEKLKYLSCEFAK